MLLEPFAVRRVIWMRWLLIFAALSMVLLLGWSALGKNLAHIPAAPVLFFEMYIKEAFPFFILANVAWFVFLRRYRPDQNVEFTFLNSLPVRNSHLADRKSVV